MTLKVALTKTDFLDVIVNNDACKTNQELADELGINVRTFYNYQKKFKLTKRDELKELAQRYSAEQIANLRMIAKEKKDPRAAAILLQIAELYEPKKRIEKQQTSIHFHIRGLSIPKNAGQSEANPSAIPERTGTAVELPEGSVKVIDQDQSENIEAELVEVENQDGQANQDDTKTGLASHQEAKTYDLDVEKGW